MDYLMLEDAGILELLPITRHVSGAWLSHRQLPLSTSCPIMHASALMLCEVSHLKSSLNADNCAWEDGRDGNAAQRVMMNDAREGFGEGLACGA